MKNLKRQNVKRELKMKSKKNNAQETVFIEVAAWSLIIGVIYIFSKIFF